MAVYRDPLYSLAIKFERTDGESGTRTVSAINAKANDEDENADGYTATQLLAFAQAYIACAGNYTFLQATRSASQPIT